ncbi:hypothetical protein ACP4OV_022602 [Aristida adscensionis]
MSVSALISFRTGPHGREGETAYKNHSSASLEENSNSQRLPSPPRKRTPPASSSVIAAAAAASLLDLTDGRRRRRRLLLAPLASDRRRRRRRRARAHPRGQAMKLKINKACDLGSISVLPPRTGGSGGVGSSVAAAAAAAAASAAASQQQRSQTLSQQSFSQGGVGSGGGSSLLHSQSQLSQASLDENLLSLHLASPARDQRFGLHDDSSKKMPSLSVSSASCLREESQLQLPKISSNPVHRWNPSPPDSKCQVMSEDIERKFQHLASSVHKMGMVLDSVQNDVMQLNRAMKEASLDSGSIQQKVVLLDSSLQKMLKGQDDLKALVESSTKSNADQLSVLNSHSRKLEDISSTLSVWPKQIEADLRQLQSDIFRIFTKEMEGIVRAIRSLNSRPSAMEMVADQSCTTNGRPQMNQPPVANERPLVNQTPVATLVNQSPVASLVRQTQVANGRLLMSQTPAENGKHLVKKTAVANGGSLMNQIPAANGHPVMSQIPAPNGRALTSQKTSANGRPHMNQIPAASGQRHTNQVPAPEVQPAPLAGPAKVADPKLKVDQGKVKALPQKLTDSLLEKKLTGSLLEKKLTGSGHRVTLTPKLENSPTRKVARQTAAKKAPIMIILDSDDDSEGRASCVTLKAAPAEKEADLMTAQATEESLEILRRARKRRRREMQAIMPVLR